MKNYWLERHIELESQNPEWQPDRVRILQSLIRETAYFGVDLEDLVRRPGPLQEGDVVDQCIKGTYDPQKAKSWVFMHLYGHTIQQANAIGILIEASCLPPGFQLWRTLYEAYVVCEFLAQFCKETPQVFQDYIGYTLLRSWIRKKEDYNKLCKDSGKKLHYDVSSIDKMKLKCEDKYRSYKDYVWAESVFGHAPKFNEILEKTGDDMTTFYRLASQEIHPTFGHRFVLTDTALPLYRWFPCCPSTTYSMLGKCTLTI